MAEAMRILITGANRGLGLEFVRQYAARGERVFAACREPDDASALRGIEQSHRDEVTIIGLSVSDAESIAHAHKAVAAHAEGLDLLINNAGIYSARVTKEGDPAEKLGSFEFDEALHVFRTNSVAPLLVAQQFLDLLKRGRSARLVNISSGFGSITQNNGFPYYYGASKAALNMLMRSFAADPATDGITTVLMSPGWVRTDMGTSAAPLSVEESVKGMIEVIDRLSPADNSRFLNHEGKEEAW